MIACATTLGDNSVTTDISGWPSASFLPITRGRAAGGPLYNNSFNWLSISGRFSSTTKISSSPSAKAAAPLGSSGHDMPTL